MSKWMTSRILALLMVMGAACPVDAFELGHRICAGWKQREKSHRQFPRQTYDSSLQYSTLYSPSSSQSISCLLADNSDDAANDDEFAFPGLLDDIDDSVFDSPRREERKIYAKEERCTFSAKSTLTTVIRGLDVSGELKRGDRVRVQVKRLDKLGVYVELLDHEISPGTLVRGMILKIEADLWASQSGHFPKVGEVIEEAFIENVRPADERVDVCLRPPGYLRVVASRDTILNWLDKKKEKLPVGKKSSPEEINKIFPNLSKSQFKAGIGALLREGAIIADERQIRLIPDELRIKQSREEPYAKPPPYWRAPEGGVMFVGSIPYEVDEIELARAIEEVIDVGHIASIKIVKDKQTGNSAGFGHVDFFEPSKAVEATEKLQGLSLKGRKLNIELKKRAAEREPLRERRSWGDSSRHGIRGFKGAVGSASNLPKLWATVYVGNLPYSAGGDSIKYLIENEMGKSGIIAGVRVASDQETGQPRGFAHVDFFEKETAVKVCNELKGLEMNGRLLILDLEKEKRPSKLSNKSSRNK